MTLSLLGGTLGMLALAAVVWALVRFAGRCGLDGVEAAVAGGLLTAVTLVTLALFASARTDNFGRSTLFVAAALACGYLVSVRNGVGRTSSTLPVEPPRTWDERLVGVLAAGVPAWLMATAAVRTLTRPVMPISDGPIYHLPFVLHWWREEAVRPLATPFGELAATYFPPGGDILLTWLTVATGTLAAARIGQMPFVLLAALALHGIAQRCGVRPGYRWLPAGFWVTSRLTYATAEIPHVDLMLPAFALCGACLLTGAGTSERPDNPAAHRWRWLLAGLAFGLMPALKSVGLPFAAPLLVAGLWIGWRSRQASGVAWMLGGFLGTAALAFGHPWLRHGNPLYPLQVRLPLTDTVLFEGWYDRAAMRFSGFHESPLRVGRLLSQGLEFLGPVEVLGLALFTACGLLTALRGRSPALRLVGGLAVLVAVSHLLLHWFVIPYNTQRRFLLTATAFAATGMVGMLPRQNAAGWRTPVAWAIVALVVLRALAPVPTTVPGGWSLLWQAPLLKPPGIPAAAGRLLPFGGLAAFLVASFAVRRRGRRLQAVVGVISLALTLAAAEGLRVGNYLSAPSTARFLPAPTVLEIAPAWFWIDRETLDAPATVAYAGTNLPYYLAGSRLQNRVRYVPVSGPLGDLPHDAFERRMDELPAATDPFPQWHRDRPDRARWLRNLHASGAALLVVCRENTFGQLRPPGGPPPFPVERRFADALPEVFTTVYGAGTPQGVQWAVVYRIDRDRLAEAAGVTLEESP